MLVFRRNQQFTARNPLEAADKAGVRIHAIGVGTSLRSNASYRDIQVSGLDCPDRMTLGNLRPHNRSRSKTSDCPAASCKAILNEDGISKSPTQELTLEPSRRSRNPSSSSFDRQCQRKTYLYGRNSADCRKKRSRRTTSRSAVSLVGRSGHQSALSRRNAAGGIRRIGRSILGQRSRPRNSMPSCRRSRTCSSNRTNMHDIKFDRHSARTRKLSTKFDVFLSRRSSTASYLRAEHARDASSNAVRDGAGLVMLGGYHSLGPGGYANTPIGQTSCPCVPGNRDIGQVTDPFLPTLDLPMASRHPIFRQYRNLLSLRTMRRRKCPACRCSTAARKSNPHAPSATVLAKLSERE